MKSDGYKWDGDTRDERESEFTASNFATTRGDAHHDSTWARDRALRKRKQRNSVLFWAVLIACGIGGLAIFRVMSHLRG